MPVVVSFKSYLMVCIIKDFCDIPSLWPFVSKGRPNFAVCCKICMWKHFFFYFLSVIAKWKIIGGSSIKYGFHFLLFFTRWYRNLVFSVKHEPEGGKLKFEWMVGIEVLVGFLLVGLRYISIEGRSFA